MAWSAELILDCAPHAAVLMDDDATVTDWSPSAERIFGATRATGRSIAISARRDAAHLPSTPPSKT